MEDYLGSELSNDCQCLGFSKNGEFGAGFAWHDMRYSNQKCISVAFSLVIRNPEVISKNAIIQFFHYPFNVLGVQRLWALIETTNKNSNFFAKKIGATLEGIARNVLVNGNDANVWSIVKSDLNNNKWWKKWV